jgi:hypothetical protein
VAAFSLSPWAAAGGDRRPKPRAGPWQIGSNNPAPGLGGLVDKDGLKGQVAEDVTVARAPTSVLVVLVDGFEHVPRS